MPRTNVNATGIRIIQRKAVLSAASNRMFSHVIAAIERIAV